MRKVALSTIQDEFSKFLRLAAKEEVVITDKGKPAGVLIGFESEDDWFDYRLERDPRFLKRVALRHQATEQKTLFDHQVIGPELYGVLTHELQAARSGVDARPRLDLPPFRRLASVFGHFSRPFVKERWT